MHTYGRFATFIVSIALAFTPACEKGGDQKGEAKKGDDKKGDEGEGGDEGPVSCGGLAGKPCPDGMTCVDDPSDDCDPAKGGADCMGICEKSDAPVSCGGFAGKPCPDGMTCVDDPSDDCDPTKGGADCIGVCKKG